MLVQYKKVWAVWHICAFDGHMQRRHMQRVLQYVAEVLAVYAGRSNPFGALNSPRLLTSGCWRERLSPTFSAYPPSAEPAELHQELLLGFDVCEGFEHSVLSMMVKKKLAREGKGSGWFADLQVRKHKPTCLASRMLCVVFGQRL